ncbi:hypothetical protein LSAT2_032687 [Lamellibrachia satsuma]|nr:hypothetical protein LSAT2_032687 [Lamellibrachia satsuma]
MSPEPTQVADQHNDEGIVSATTCYMAAVLALWLLLLPLLHSTTTTRIVTLGEALIPRPDLKPFSLHMVVVMRDVIFKRGKITAFHAFFNETPTVFCFQIWRPRADDTMLTMTLAGERCVNSSMSGNLTIDLTAKDRLPVEVGDRLGFTQRGNHTLLISATFTHDSTSKIYYHELAADDNYPSLGDEIQFNHISIPFNFSVGVTYLEDTIWPDVQQNVSLLHGYTGPQGHTGPPVYLNGVVTVGNHKPTPQLPDPLHGGFTKPSDRESDKRD